MIYLVLSFLINFIAFWLLIPPLANLWMEGHKLAATLVAVAIYIVCCAMAIGIGTIIESAA